MLDAKPEEKRRRCVGCGQRVKMLFVQYSPSNIRLMKCDNCKAVADPYIECEFMIILIDLILHKARAYRHLLFNMMSIDSCDNKGILQQSSLIYILLEAYRIYFLEGSKADADSFRSLSSTIFTCSKLLIDAVLGSFIFVLILLVGAKLILKLPFDIIRYKELLLAIIISSYFKLFLVTMMVWEFPSSVIFIIDIFMLSSNVVALRVMTQMQKSYCFVVCVAAHVTKLFAERWLLHVLGTSLLKLKSHG